MQFEGIALHEDCAALMKQLYRQMYGDVALPTEEKEMDSAKPTEEEEAEPAAAEASTSAKHPNPGCKPILRNNFFKEHTWFACDIMTILCIHYHCCRPSVQGDSS